MQALLYPYYEVSSQEYQAWEQLEQPRYVFQPRNPYLSTGSSGVSTGRWVWDADEDLPWTS